MVILAIYNVFLAKYTAQDDIVVGTPIAGRPHADLQQIIGMFVNTLALRNYPKSDKVFIDFLKELTEGTLTSFDHLDFPFEELVGKLDLERAVSRTPLFDTMFSFFSESAPETKVSTLDFKPYNLDHKTAKFDLQLDARDYQDSVKLGFTYATHLFKAETVKRFADHFQSILYAVLENPRLKIGDIQMLTPIEKEQICSTFNETVQVFNDRDPLHILFETQVQKQPEAIALKFENQTMTYAELNQKSNQLALHLRNNGVQPDSVVGLITSRSVEMVIGMLGILKAGGAYLPIDPLAPVDRLKYMLDNSNVKLVLTNEHVKLAKKINQIDLRNDTIYACAFENLTSVNTVNNLAYVIYTSGSTGQPKGVMLEHISVVNRIEWMKSTYDFSENDCVLQKTPYYFDVSVWEFFMTLCYGGQLVLCPQEVVNNAELLVNMVDKENITMLHFVPSMLKAFLVSLAPEDKSKLSGLKHVFSSGEALELSTVKAYHEALGAKLHNLYGPTETAIDVTYHETNANDNMVPIGQPIWNTSLFILDEQQNIQPIGIPGELYIGGIGLARGYSNQPELTDARFIKHPFKKGERLYKTGDLVRWLSNGKLEFLGRLDFQVKIRGYRVELEDISHQLMQCEAISEAAVADHKRQDGSTYLCAYYIAQNEQSITELKRDLAAHLPEYMIPAYFVKLMEMPLSLNGKLNRKALPKPTLTDTEIKTYAAPVSEMEKKLADVWGQIFDLETVGIHDNFFSIGGDSIKTIQLTALLLKDKLRLEMAKVFQYPTIKSLASHIQKSGLIIAQEAAKGQVKLTPIQARFFEQNYPKPEHYNQAVMLESQSTLNIDTLSQALQSVMNHHDALRLVFKIKAEVVSQSHSDIDQPNPIHEFDLSGISDVTQETERLASQVQSRFDLENGPLFKCAVFYSDAKTYVLLVGHHLVIDVVSWPIIIEDLMAAFMTHQTGGRVQLQDKTQSYQEWSNILEHYAQSSNVQAEVTYWNAQNAIPVPSLRIDFDQAKVKTIRSHDLMFSETDTQRILNQINTTYQTEINDVLLSVLGLSIKNWSGADKLRIDLEGHGRENITESVEISRTVGWFTAIFPSIIDMTSSDIRRVLQSTKNYRKSMPNKGLGYGMLKYIMNGEQQPKVSNQNPPEIMFNYLGQIGGRRQNDESQSDEIIKWSNMPFGEAIASENKEGYKLNITAAVNQGQLHVSIEYSPEQYKLKTIQTLGRHFKKAMKEVIDHCLLKQKTILFNYDATQVTAELETLITTPVFALKDNQSDKNVFFFPPAIGFSMIYQELANHITGYNVYGVNFLEDENRIDQYIHQLVKINGAQPFIFIGYSGGANLAYEVATVLEEKGLVVSDIIMFDGMREMDQVKMSDLEMKDKVFEYIGEDENHPSHQLLKTKPERDRVRRIVETYQHFLNNQLNNGSTQANIHQIKSTQDWEEGNERKAKWQDVTSGDFVNYQGAGGHGDMLFGEHLKSNSKILKNILK